MYHVELSQEECVVLHEVLADRLADIRREIHHTDRRDFRRLLLEREELLARLVSRVEQAHLASLVP